MNNHNLNKAADAAKTLARLVRESHTDAVNGDNQFAEIALFDLIRETIALEDKLERLAMAANDEYEKQTRRKTQGRRS